MIQLAMIGEINIDIREGMIPDASGAPVQCRTLIVSDAQSGITVHVPIPVAQANRTGLALQGKTILTPGTSPR